MIIIHLKKGSFPSSILSLLVTRESALFPRVVKRHFPLPKILYIVDLPSLSDLDKRGPFQWIIASLPISLISILPLLASECISTRFPKVRAFYCKPLNVYYENLSIPKHKSLKLFVGIFYGYRH